MAEQISSKVLDQIEGALEFHVTAGDDTAWNLLTEALQALRAERGR